MTSLCKYPLLMVIIILVAFILPFDNVFAETMNDCIKDTICVRIEQQERNILFFAKNFKGITQTVTFDLPELDSMTADASVPLTVSCPAKSEVRLVKLTCDDSSAFRYTYRYWVTRGSLMAVHDASYVYRLPFRQGESYSVVQGFGGVLSHNGDSCYAVDFGLPVGTVVLAAREGVAVDIRIDSDVSGPSEDFADYGNYVIIEHSDKTLGEYWHLKKNGALVKVGQYVKQGTPIGISGDTGFSSGPHLHFMITSPSSGKSLKSHRFRFKCTEGIVDDPVEGKKYTAE